MFEHALQRATDGLSGRGGAGIGIGIAFVLAVASIALAAPIAAADYSSPPGPELDGTPIQVDPPETAEFDVNATENEPFHFELESADSSFYVNATVVPESGNATIRLVTDSIDDDPDAYLSASGADIRITEHRNEFDRGTLPGGLYDLRVSGDRSTHYSTLEVKPSVRLDRVSPLNATELESDPELSITGQTDLDTNETVQIRAMSSGEVAFLITNETTVDEDGTFETTIDLDPAPEGADVEITARHDNVTRASMPVYVRSPTTTPGAGNQTNDGITFVYEGDRIELEAAPEQRVTGEAALEEGDTVIVRLRGSGETPFLVTDSVDVDERGHFEATVDLEDIDPGTEFYASARAETDSDIQGEAPGYVVEADLGEAEHGDVTIDDGTGSGSTVSDRNLFGGLGALAVGTLLSVFAIGLLLVPHRFRG